MRAVRTSRLAAVAILACAVLRAQEMPAVREVTLTLTEGTSMAASASPDRRWIAIDLLGSIWILPFRGGEATKITPDFLEARQPTWAPDSDTLAFQGYGDDGVWHIYAISRAGDHLRQLTRGVFDDREPAWSHDGTRIAFSSDRAGSIYSIWQVAVESGNIAQAVAHDGWMPTWARDDAEITFVSEDRVRKGAPVPTTQSARGIWAVDVHARERLVVAAQKDAPIPVAPSWNPAGTQLAWITPTGLNLVTDPNVRPEDAFPFRPQWLSADTLLYTADGHIRRRSLRLASVVDVPFRATVTLRRHAYAIAHRPLETTEPQRVAGIASPAISPAGDRLAFVALGDVWVIPIGGRATRLTDDAAVELDPAWSPDGAQLAFSSDRTGTMELWVHDFRTNEERQLTHDLKGRVSGAAWSPDGSQIAFLLDGRGVRTVQMRRGDCAGGGERSQGAHEIGRPTWAPGCRAVAVGALFPYSDRFREGLNQLLLFDFESSSWSASILSSDRSAGNRQSTGPVWSPDGTLMAFVTDGRLWTVAVDGRGVPTAAPVAIADDEPDSPSWEGDSRHLVYQTPRGVRRIARDGGDPVPIAADLRWRSSEPPPRVTVHAGRVFDGVRDSLRGPLDIIVEGGLIAEVVDHDDTHHVGSVIDAGDEVVMPGLIEMHAHHDRTYGADFGRIWLAYGITGLRIPAVNPYEGLELRESFDSGRRPGPRVYIAGDPFDGERVYYPGGVSVTSEDQLARELDRATALDIDFFKTYVRLPDTWQKRIVDYAHEHGRPVTSHEIFPAAAYGVDGVEHLRGTSRRGYSPKVSEAGIAYRDVIDVIAKSEMTLTPTIVLQGGFRAREAGDRTLLTDPRLSLFPDAVAQMLVGLASERPDPRRDSQVKPYEATIKAIASAGGTLLGGTDAPIFPYGLSLHVELEEYVHAGLTPFQALQTVTTNAARALGLADELGTIAAGRRADLTFVGGDPLGDIRAARDVRRVMRGGRVYTISDLVRRRDRR